MADNDSIEVQNFFFHSLRKFRVFPSSTRETVGRNRFAVSSAYSLAFVASPNNELLCFSTRAVTSYVVTKENMNKEVTDLPMKKLQIDDVEIINEIGINCDGSLLAVLHSTKGSAFVDIYSVPNLASLEGQKAVVVHKTRVSSNHNSTGCSLEWNPAFADTFAASSSDNTILVLKIDVKNNTKVSVIGSKKFGAQGLVISWSPKGKQLVIGDSCGKIVQLKPELDVVRSTMPPESSSNAAVSGLCWLSTTEWLVAYATTQPTITNNSFILVVKKDKGPEWRQLHDLSYCNPKATLPPNLLSATDLLVEWNVALVVGSRFSEVVAVGKQADLWQSWTLDEGKGINLPTRADRTETFPLGIAVDRSAQDEALISIDGSKRVPPAPIVFVLTTDGVVTAHHVINQLPGQKSIQIKPIPINLNGFKASSFESQPVPSATSSTASPFAAAAAAATANTATNSLFSSSAATPTTGLFGATQSTPVSKGLFSTPSAASATTPSTTFFTSPASAFKPPLSATPSISSAAAMAPSVVKLPPISTSTPAAAPAAAPEDEAEKQKLAELAKKKQEEEKKAQLKAKQEAAIKLMELLNKELKAVTSGMAHLAVGLQKVAPCVTDCASEVKESTSAAKEVITEMQMLMSSIEDGLRNARKHIEDISFDAQEKAKLIEEFHDVERIAERLRIMEDADKQLRYNELEANIDVLKEKFASATRILENVQKMNKKMAIENSPLRKSSNMSHIESETVLRTMRKVAKIVQELKEKLQRTERDVAEMLKSNKIIVKTSKPSTSSSIQVLNLQQLGNDGILPTVANLLPHEIAALRLGVVQKIKKHQSSKMRKITVSSSFVVPPTPAKKFGDTSSLSAALFNLSMTPRRVDPSTPKFTKNRDAATQADAPPVEVVKVEKVYIETPPKPTIPTEASVPSATKAPVAAEVSTTSSLFGGVPAKPTGLKFFGGTNAAAKPFNFKKSEEQVAKVEEPKPVVKAEPVETVPVPVVEAKPVPEVSAPETPKKKEEVVEVKPEEPEKLLPVAEEVVPPKEETPVKAAEEAKEVTPAKTEPAAPATPSFSFGGSASKSLFDGSSATPTTTAAAQPSSIFGGGVAAQPATTTAPASSSSIFGGGTSVQPATTTTTTSSIFGGGAAAQPATSTTSSIFGGGPASQPTTSATSVFGSSVTAQPSASSIFGGGTAKPTSPFGSFGQAAKPAESSPSAVSFSFNKAASAAAQPTPNAVSFSFNKSPAPQQSSFAAAAASAANDEGMEDDGMNSNSGGSNLFGGTKGFLSGFGGGNAPSANASTNIFSKPTTTSSPGSNSWLFGGGGGQQQQQKSSFGSFASAAAQQAQQQEQQKPASGFGAAPKFGSSPMFGSKPAFGGGAQQQPTGSVFGGGTAQSTTGGGFAQFASGSASSNLFGGGAAQPKQQSSSIFGGGANIPSTNSNIFGGGSQNKNQFTSWR